jgi:hypothetical protein
VGTLRFAHPTALPRIRSGIGLRSSRATPPDDELRSVISGWKEGNPNKGRDYGTKPVDGRFRGYSVATLKETIDKIGF